MRQSSKAMRRPLNKNGRPGQRAILPAVIFLALPVFAAHSAAAASASCASAFQDAGFEGEGELHSEYLDLSAASDTAAGLNLSTAAEYMKFVKANPGLGLPLDPRRQYPEEFKGWAAFLQIAEPDSSAAAEEVKGMLRDIADDLSLPHYAGDNDDQLMEEGADFFAEEKGAGSAGLKKPAAAGTSGKRKSGKKPRQRQAARPKAPKPKNPSASAAQSAAPSIGHNSLRSDFPSLERFAELMGEHDVKGLSHYKEIRAALMEETGHKLPFDPGKFYGCKGQWPGWRAITGRFIASNAPSYEEFERILKERNITSRRHYERERRAIMEEAGLELPFDPGRFYKPLWPGWRAVLGFQRFPPYEEFKRIVKEHGVQSEIHYKKIRKAIMAAMGLELPFHPERAYGEQWEGWSSITGSGRKHISREELPSLEEFVEIIRRYGIRTVAEYKEKRKAMEAELGHPLPSNPNRFYGPQWPEWSGVTGHATKFGPRKISPPPLERFIEVMREHNIQSFAHYEKERLALMEKTGLFFHNRPDKAYGPQWPGWRAVIKSAKAAEEAPPSPPPP